MVWTILFVLASCMIIAFVSWTIGFRMADTSYWLAKRFYILPLKEKKLNDSITHPR